MSLPSPLELSFLSVFIFFLIALSAPFLSGSQTVLINFSFSLAALASALGVVSGAFAVWHGTTETVTLPIGLPDLPFYIRLDPLSGFFITVTALLGLYISIYSIGYLRGFLGKKSLTTLVVFYALFMAGMLLVLLSDDAYFFMISWELMAASSYFLVVFEDEYAQNRRAGFLYLVVAHVGAVFILMGYGVIAGSATGFENFTGYTFQAMRDANINSTWASAAFLLTFLGFAAKAGMVPLHVWLPEAHPVAPSNVSALMSGVMLKTAIYGIIRVTFDILHMTEWWWGGVVLSLGLVTAVMGVLYALMQNDLKRLLAYSSVENIGIILICLGLAMIFTPFNMTVLAALALVAGLYHVLNHAMFKGLLFMGAGSVLHATGKRNMEEMGGLIHHMPWTAAFFLVGSLSISALPPFNGFVSEWLTFQAFLLSPVLPNAVLNLLIPLGAALLALTGTLAAASFVKAFGVTFLGHSRAEHPVHAHEANIPMRIGMGLAAVTCLFLGVFPTLIIDWLDILPDMLVGAKIGTSAGEFGWLWLTPVAAERASYSAPMVFLGIMAVIGIVYLLFHAKGTAIRRVPLWDCGFEKVTNRMQYNSTSFAMPMRRILGFLFMVKETKRAPEKGGTSPMFRMNILYHLKIRDRVWHFLYKPVPEISFWFARKVGKLQHGRIQIYLLYSFVTLLVLLAFS